MSSADNLIVALAVLGFVLWRQLQPRDVREDSPYRLMILLGAVGLVDLVGFADDHRVSALAWALVGASLLAGVVLGLLRGTTVRIWRRDGVLVRQGTPATVALWGIGLGIHALADLAINGIDASARGIGSTSILLYFGIALAAQRFATLNRAAELAG